MFTAAELLEAQHEIALRAGYPLTGDRRAGYTARRFANDLNTIYPGVVRLTNGRPHQLYHARRGAMRVPPHWERPVRELLSLARIGFKYPPTPPPWPRPRHSWGQRSCSVSRNKAKAPAVG